MKYEFIVYSFVLRNLAELRLSCATWSFPADGGRGFDRFGSAGNRAFETQFAARALAWRFSVAWEEWGFLFSLGHLFAAEFARYSGDVVVEEAIRRGMAT